MDPALPCMGASDRGDETIEGGQESRKQKRDHEKGKETSLGEQPTGIIANLDEENTKGLWAQKQTGEVMQWEKGTEPVTEKPFDFRVAPKVEGSKEVVALTSVDKDNDPMSMSYDASLGWVVEPLGP